MCEREGKERGERGEREGRERGERGERGGSEGGSDIFAFPSVHHKSKKLLVLASMKNFYRLMLKL